MDDTKQLLERAARAAPGTSFDLDGIQLRRERRRRGERVRAGAVGLTLAVAAVAVVATAMQRTDGDRGRTNVAALGQLLPPATASPAVAGDGDYHVRAILLAGCFGDGDACADGGDYRLDATFWWAPSNDSGRIEVDARANYGIEEGRFDPSSFPNPNGIDVSSFPLEATALTEFLLERSAEDGASPAPLVTPPPEGGPLDGRLWRAITDLLPDPHLTPVVRAALLDVAAGLQGSHVTLDSTDPFGRPAHVIEFGNWGGQQVERLFVDPANHELLCWTKSAADADLPFEYLVVQDAGVVGSMETGVSDVERTVPLTVLSAADLEFGPQPIGGGVQAGAVQRSGDGSS